MCTYMRRPESGRMCSKLLRATASGEGLHWEGLCNTWLDFKMWVYSRVVWLKATGKTVRAFWPSHSSLGILRGERSRPFQQMFVSVVTEGPWRRAGRGNSGMKALMTLGRVLIWGMLRYTCLSIVAVWRWGVWPRGVVETGLPEKAECGCSRPQVVPSFCVPTSTCWGSQLLHKLISPWFLSIFYILGLLVVKTMVIF